jgi:hypothetical protein
MKSDPGLAIKHNLYRDALFRSKTVAYSLRRWLKDRTWDRVDAWPRNDLLAHAAVLSESTSQLWNAEDNDLNWILTAGKVENLRVAARRLHGVELPANTVFSFWQHIGMPSRSRGFVVGREIREGCLVPTVAGGLCQLSNALYDAACQAGLAIVERHRHTQVISGSFAERDMDATVKWNYVDLRFRTSDALRVEVEVDREHLIVRFRGRGGRKDVGINKLERPPVRLNDCLSCGNAACFKYKGAKQSGIRQGTTVFAVDEWWPEYEQYIRSVARPGDLFMTPFPLTGPLKRERYRWRPIQQVSHQSMTLAALRRALDLRLKDSSNGSRPRVLINSDERILRAMCRSIPVECTHLVIAQNLLPFAWKHGILGGRTFDVLMTRAPMEYLHRDLDRLALRYVKSKTAADFRAPRELVACESAALTASGHVITPHRAIAAIFNNKSVLLDWSMTGSNNTKGRGQRVLFPASALARKGAYEMREVARILDLDLVVLGRDMEAEGFWEDIRHSRPSGQLFDEVGLVVLPAYVEHQPRLLLHALSLGIPVVTTSASGIGEKKGVSIVPIGDTAQLERVIRSVLKGTTFQ